MALTLRQRALVHIMVQHFDRESQTTTLDPARLASELSADVDDLAKDIAELQRQGYLEHMNDADPQDPEAWSTLETWVVNPTDRAVLSAMGLE